MTSSIEQADVDSDEQKFRRLAAVEGSFGGQASGQHKDLSTLSAQTSPTSPTTAETARAFYACNSPCSS